MTTVQKAVGAFVLAVLTLAAGTLAVRAAYGAFANTYELTGTFPRAGQGLLKGSIVKLRGVKVGEVSGIRLVDRQVEIDLAIENGVEVPVDVVATVRPNTLFGEKFVELAPPDGFGPPYHVDGGVLAEGDTANEVEDLFAAAVPLFDRIDVDDVATILTELVEGTRGEGDTIAAGFDSGARLAALFADTIDAQLRALDSLAVLQDELRATGDDLNSLSANSNLSLPVLNRARADLARILDTLGPFADQLSELLAAYRPDIDTILADGDNIVRALLVREEELTETVIGLADYALTFAEAGGTAPPLPDGSKFAFFKNFIFFEDVNDLICNVVAPPFEGLEPLQEALLDVGIFDCSDLVGAGASAASAPESTDEIAARIRTNLTGVAAEPDQPVRADLGSLIDRLLGGGR